MGNLNIHLLKYGRHNSINEFHEELPLGTSETLINNIFSNFVSNNIVSGNSSASISDYLLQYYIFANIS